MARAMIGDEGPRIFIVEPDWELRQDLIRQFRSAGWQAEGFATGHEFLRRPCYRGIGCAVLDVRLPDLQGCELYRQMLARGSNLPVIFVSDFNDAPTAIAAIRQGAVDFLIKPVATAILLQAIEVALARHAALCYSQARREVVEERLATLTRRQREVLQHVLGGAINKQVAATLGITLKTVKAHRAQAMRKMGFRSVATLVHALEETREPTNVPVLMSVPTHSRETSAAPRVRRIAARSEGTWPVAVRLAG